MDLAFFALRRLFLIAAISCGLMSAASAKGSVYRIDMPIPDQLLGRVTDLFKKVRPGDWSDAVRNARMLRTIWSDQIILRTDAGCSAVGICMVLVGRVAERMIELEVLLDAGDSVYFSDVAYGDASPPLFFEGHNGAGIVAISRQPGWLITACQGCTAWRLALPRNEIMQPPPAQPVPKPLAQSFDMFRHELEGMRTPIQ